MTSVGRHYRFDMDFLHRKIFIFSQSNSVQNLSSLTLKTKELEREGGKHLPCVWRYPLPVRGLLISGCTATISVHAMLLALLRCLL